MEIKKSRVKQLTAKPSFTGMHGVLYPADVEMENGDKGEINSKTADYKFWQIGTELEYQIDNVGKYSKLKKINPSQSATWQSAPVQSTGNFQAPIQDAEKQRLIISQNALTNAVNFHAIARNPNLPPTEKEVEFTQKFFFDLILKTAKGE